MFAEILQSLAGQFQRNRDRMGLVALQGRQATVLHHPTHNYRIVTRHLRRLTFHGETPLADGLRKALAAARIERRKNPGSQSLVVLLSDCCPEPVAPGHYDLFEEPNYRDSRAAAGLFRKERVPLLVLLAGPRPHARERAPAFLAGGDRPARPPGDRLAEAMAAASGGRLVRLPFAEEGRVSRAQIDHVLGAIEAMFEGGARTGAERPAVTSGIAPPLG